MSAARPATTSLMSCIDVLSIPQPQKPLTPPPAQLSPPAGPLLGLAIGLLSGLSMPSSWATALEETEALLFQVSISISTRGSFQLILG